MKIHLWPKVILVTRPSIVWEGVRELLAENDLTLEDWRRGENDEEGDQIPELMGRLCYQSFGTKQGRVGAGSYLGHILESGHGSVLEHAVWGFVACRAGRGYTHQMVRHRAGFAYSQESTHFIRYGEEAAVCLPGLPADARGDAARACQASLKAYDELWDELRRELPADAKVKKVVSGNARALLPNALESKLGFSGNARALRHFVENRGNPHNTLEVRAVACQVAAIMKVEAPATFGDVEVYSDEDGYASVRVTHHKV